MKKLLAFKIALAAIISLFISCQSDSSVAPQQPGGTGQGGSTARFAMVGNYLYTVNTSGLALFDVQQPAEPKMLTEIPLSFGVETIFPFQDKLFIGTQTGMQIWNIQQPELPRLLSVYQHVYSCDPVVTDGRYAYVTLRTDNTCARGVNRLEIIDIQNSKSPVLVKEYEMENPKGLGIDGTHLFVCDKGLKVYDATDVNQLQLKHHFPVNAADLIAQNGYLLVIGSNGFYQYRYTNHSLELLSKINVEPALQ